jgi:replicative DNA helicase
MSYNEKEEYLKVISQRDAIIKANAKIKEAMETQYPGLLCRWDKVNEIVGGCWHFKEITFIAGPSGAGKSFILNSIREDFAGELNRNYPRPFKILAFSFEMGADDEIIRTYSSRLKTSYSTLMSAYKKITKDYYSMIEETSKHVDNDIIFYVESTGNRQQIYNTIRKFHETYPQHQLVITIDHTLLMEHLDEFGEVELVSSMAKLAMLIKRDFNAMVIMLGQLNDKIEQPDRIKNPILHFPKKTDIHSSKAVFMMSDNLVIINRPEMIQITEYGLGAPGGGGWPTKDLIAWHFLKSRLYGKEGLVRMKQDFAHGNLIYPYEQ